MRAAWPVWILAGCASRDARIGAYLEGGFHDRAFAEAASDPAREARVRQALLDDLGLSVALQPVPAEAFGAAPRGYGETWTLMGLGLERAPGVADHVTVDVAFDGWTRCSTCDPAWLRAQLAPPPPEGEAPRIEVHTSPGVLGLLSGAGALAELAFHVSSVFVVPMAMWLDTMLLPGTLQSGDDLKPYALTGLVLRALLDDPDGSAVGAEVAAEAAGGFTCVGDLPCSALVVFVPGGGSVGGARVTVTAARGALEAQGAQVVPVTGPVAEAAVAAFPTEGRRLELAAR